MADTVLTHIWLGLCDLHSWHGR